MQFYGLRDAIFSKDLAATNEKKNSDQQFTLKGSYIYKKLKSNFLVNA